MCWVVTGPMPISWPSPSPSPFHISLRQHRSITSTRPLSKITLTPASPPISSIPKRINWSVHPDHLIWPQSKVTSETCLTRTSLNHLLVYQPTVHNHVFSNDQDKDCLTCLWLYQTKTLEPHQAIISSSWVLFNKPSPLVNRILHMKKKEKPGSLINVSLQEQKVGWIYSQYKYIV